MARSKVLAIWLLIGLGLGVAGVAACWGTALRELLWRWTGEEELLPQLRGVFHLLSALPLRQPDGAPFEAICHADVNPYGVNAFLEQEVEASKREQAVAMIAAAGFHWIRQEFPWEDIEIHGKGDFEDRRTVPHKSAWQKYDEIVSLAQKYGLELIVRLSNPPAWSRASGDAGGTLAPPDNFEDFGDFVAAVVSRYKGKVRYYQIWNEPNIYPEWGERPVSPEEYTKLLRVAYTRAKAVDPEVVIVAGALAATIENDLYPHGMSDLIFLQRMYDAGAAPYFDIMSVQGYGLWSGPYDRRMRPRVINYSRPIYIRDIMVKNGDAQKPIWISEMNWNAIPLGHPAWPMFGRVTLEQQAAYAVAAYRRAQLEWPWVGVINFWYLKRATDAERDQPMYYFRMLEPDFTPLPVYYALAALAHSEPVLGLGRHQEQHWAISYEGAWRQRKGEQFQCGRALEGSSGSVRLRFRGTELAIRAAGPAKVGVSLDGGQEQALQLDEGPPRDVVVAHSLADEEHIAILRVLSGDLLVDSYVVWRRASWQRELLLLALPPLVALAMPILRRF